MKFKFLIAFITIFFLQREGLLAQETTSCKVELPMLNGVYTGDCKNGFASGKGEAKGAHQYVGIFKNGLPNGKGKYIFNDGSYHEGVFQDGLREGKGEAHFIRNGLPDSVVVGYWSADEFRGKNYVTYLFGGAAKFEQFEITPSSQSGNTVTFEISNLSGPVNSGKLTASVASSLSINEVIPTNAVIVNYVSSNETANKTSVTYTISKFPVSLTVTMSNGQSFDLELYKSAAWSVKLFINR